MFNGTSQYIDKCLSPYLFGYRKGHSTEQCLVTMIEFWRKALDNKCSAGAVLTDLSKAFGSLNHKLLIVKLAAYGFENCVLGFIYDYLTKRRKRTKVGESWRELKWGGGGGYHKDQLLGPCYLISS